MLCLERCFKGDNGAAVHRAKARNHRGKSGGRSRPKYFEISISISISKIEKNRVKRRLCNDGSRAGASDL